MAKKTTESLTLFSQKKLLGKAHTSNLKLDGNETIGSAVQLSSTQIFGQSIPSTPSKTLYDQQGGSGASTRTVEYVEFDIVSLGGTTYDANDAGGGSGTDSGESSQVAGPHGYALKLASDYESQTDNDRSKSGNGVFNNEKLLYTTFGALQIVPPSFSQETDNPYVLKIYKNDGQALGENNEIGIADDIDWQIDTYNGILFVQDYNSAKIPYKARGFIYVGDMVSDIASGGGGSISSIVAGEGLSGGGSSGAVTLNVERPFSRTKLSQKVLVNHPTDSIFTVSGSDISVANHDPNYVDLFLNGQLLLSGSSSDMLAGTVDYNVISNSTVKFSFDLEIDDIVTLIVLQG